MSTTIETHETRDRELHGPTAKAVTTLFDVGRLWAAHGLGIGRSALDASAQTLRATAELLGELKGTFEKPAAEVEDEEEEAA